MMPMGDASTSIEEKYGSLIPINADDTRTNDEIWADWIKDKPEYSDPAYLAEIERLRAAMSWYKPSGVVELDPQNRWRRWC
jgi:hypothetical protein